MRCDWFQHVVGVRSMAALPFILAAAHVEYKAPIPKDADLDVELTCPRVGTKSWEFAYTLRDGRTGAVHATATTVQVAYDYAAGASVPVPDALRTLLATLHGPGLT